MPESLCSGQQVGLGAAAAYACLALTDYFLGKTQKVKPNSLIELLLTTALMLVAIYARRIYDRSGKSSTEETRK